MEFVLDEIEIASENATLITRSLLLNQLIANLAVILLHRQQLVDLLPTRLQNAIDFAHGLLELLERYLSITGQIFGRQLRLEITSRALQISAILRYLLHLIVHLLFSRHRFAQIPHKLVQLDHDLAERRGKRRVARLLQLSQFLLQLLHARFHSRSLRIHRMQPREQRLEAILLLNVLNLLPVFFRKTRLRLRRGDLPFT